MLDKTYDPSGIEQRRYDDWLANALFESHPDNREAYTVVIPPPNVTGILHMGHCLNNTIQDILIRRARMQGRNACWVPGTDHASIATEAKVVAMLKEMGIDKKTLNREDFLKYAWEWKEKYGGIILSQLKKLGCALDWTRTSFTMDPDYYNAVIDVFIDLHNKGHIYRGVKMINWDPVAKTALSDEEVNYKEVKSKLYYVKYKLVDGDGFITVATTRPETILGDTAVCVNPNDERYKALVGKQCFVPLINRSVLIIADEYIDIEFGTGVLKVTPAHDINDYNLGIKHNLEVIDTLNDDGTMSPAAQLYVGEDRFIVRKKIAKQLEAEGLLDKVEEITNTNGFSERTDAVIEPRLSMQWWCNMTSMAKPALETVMSDEVKFYPAKFKNTYRHWMENIKDWCISRQLWWGHRIPAYYLPDGKFAVAKSAEEAFETLTNQHPDSAKKYSINDLKQDEDVLDTWFSSWLWPIEVFKGVTNPKNDEIKYYYPTATLVTAPEIIFFWVARMIMAG
ncbi:MAG TPA: valine--tRNA ligase, partial [Chitinophagales bacterium]|nr:valine--tRNA ligase [Chitinophagales bacterium]